jgi:hypothetical protein
MNIPALTKLVLHNNTIMSVKSLRKQIEQNKKRKRNEKHSDALIDDINGELLELMYKMIDQNIKEK